MVQFKSYEGNRDGGDVEEEKPRLDVKTPENAEQIKAEGKKPQDTVKASPGDRGIYSDRSWCDSIRSF